MASVFYHKEKGEILVHTEAEKKALGEGWFDNPNFEGEQINPPEPKKEDGDEKGESNG